MHRSMWDNAKFWGYVLALVGTILAAWLRWELEPIFGDTAHFITFYLPMAGAAAVGGWGPGLLATVLGTLVGVQFFVHPPGRLEHVHDVARLLFFVTTGLIVSLLGGWAQRVRRQALSQSRRLGSILENMADGYLLLDGEMRIREANREAGRVKGWPSEKLVGHTLTEVHGPERMAAVEQRCRQALSGGQTMRFEERGEGETWYEVDAYPQEGGLALFFRDITQRRQAEEALAAAKLAAEQAKVAAEEANRAKDHFLAVLSHELRTPLTPVVAALSLLQHDCRCGPGTGETLEMVRRNVEMEARLIDDLLDVTRISRGKIELERRTVDLCTVLQRAAEVCTPDIEARGLHFGVTVVGGPFWVDADAGRLQQVFWNLIKNSIKFTPHGGCVGVRCEVDGGNEVVTEVSDSGAGIEPENLGRIFNAFEQGGSGVTRQFGGLGLGLAISKALVEMHGGVIEAFSAGKGKGASFRVKLPMVAAAKQALPVLVQPVGEKESGARHASSLRILLVEDHGDTARMMKRLLESEGHQVQTAGDVATALATAAGQELDLVVSDLGLPDGSGVDLMRSLRARGSSVPGIAISGFGREEDMQRSREVGFAEHLTKPVNVERLLEAVERVGKG